MTKGGKNCGACPRTNLVTIKCEHGKRTDQCKSNYCFLCARVPELYFINYSQTRAQYKCMECVKKQLETLQTKNHFVLTEEIAALRATNASQIRSSPPSSPITMSTTIAEIQLASTTIASTAEVPEESENEGSSMTEENGNSRSGTNDEQTLPDSPVSTDEDEDTFLDAHDTVQQTDPPERTVATTQNRVQPLDTVQQTDPPERTVATTQNLQTVNSDNEQQVASHEGTLPCTQSQLSETIGRNVLPRELDSGTPSRAEPEPDQTPQNQDRNEADTLNDLAMTTENNLETPQTSETEPVVNSRRAICRYLKKGKCNRRYTTCTYRHPKICRYWVRNPLDGCPGGCGFYHPADFSTGAMQYQTLRPRANGPTDKITWAEVKTP